MDIEIMHKERRRVIGIRRRIEKAKVGDFIREAFEIVGPYFRSKSMEMTGFPVAIFYENIGNEMDIAAGATVIEVTSTDGEIGELELAGGKVATTIFTGPYEGIPDAWAEFYKEITARGETIVEPCWEEYITDPSEEPDSSKWQTLMVQPLSP